MSSRLQRRYVLPFGVLFYRRPDENRCFKVLDVDKSGQIQTLCDRTVLNQYLVNVTGTPGLLAVAQINEYSGHPSGEACEISISKKELMIAGFHHPEINFAKGNLFMEAVKPVCREDFCEVRQWVLQALPEWKSSIRRLQYGQEVKRIGRLVNRNVDLKEWIGVFA